MTNDTSNHANHNYPAIVLHVTTLTMSHTQHMVTHVQICLAIVSETGADFLHHLDSHFAGERTEPAPYPTTCG